jgi:hypothetical protein
MVTTTNTTTFANPRDDVGRLSESKSELESKSNSQWPTTQSSVICAPLYKDAPQTIKCINSSSSRAAIVAFSIIAIRERRGI